MNLSTKVNILNYTFFEFKLISKELKWGSWKNPPIGLIPPEKAYSFIVEDTTGAAAGSEGSVTYAFGANIMHIKFCDSYSLNGNYASIDFQNTGKEQKMYEIELNFRAKTNNGSWNDNYCPPAGHPLNVEFHITAESPRVLSDKAFAEAKKTAPNISQDTFLVLSGVSSVYNCIAWSMGITYAWINYVTDIENILDLYASAGKITHKTKKGIIWKANFNYIPIKTGSKNANIDIFTTSSGYVDHASRLYEDAFFKNGVWTSKLGNNFLVSHKRHALEDSLYGNVTRSLKKTVVKKDSLDASNKAVELRDFSQIYKAKHLSIMLKPLDEKKLVILNLSIENLDKKLKQVFDKKYTIWKNNYSKSHASNTYQYTLLEGFQELVDMGESILHLVVKEMLMEHNFSILVLYEKIQNNPTLLADYQQAEKDRFHLESEQSRARRVVHLYLQNLS